MSCPRSIALRPAPKRCTNSLRSWASSPRCWCPACRTCSNRRLKLSRRSCASTATRNSRQSEPAEPVVTLVLPIAAGVVVLHPHGGDVFRILEAELRGNPDFDREAVGARQGLVIELERQLRLRVERRRHVDRVRIALGALEPDIFGAGVGADALEEIGQLHALPGADGAPALDTDVARDLRDLRQLVELRQ